MCEIRRKNSPPPRPPWFLLSIQTPGQNRVKDPHLNFSPLLIFIFLPSAMDGIVNGAKKY